jgi:hypothetical protein
MVGLLLGRYDGSKLLHSKTDLLCPAKKIWDTISFVGREVLQAPI